MNCSIQVLASLMALAAVGCAPAARPAMDSPEPLRPTPAVYEAPSGLVPLAAAQQQSPPRATAASAVPSALAGTAVSPAPRSETNEPSSLNLDTSVFFASIRVKRDTALSPLEIRLHAELGDGPFGELTRRRLGKTLRDQRILVRLPTDYPLDRDPVLTQHRACSYVIDCDTEALRQLGHGELPAPPTIGELVAFTNRHVYKKSLARGFDIASEVAISREGDCTEHAVLLTALARKYHHAARVVLGFAVIRLAEQLPVLVGHAWSEIHDGQRWQLADAALFGAGLDQVPGFVGLSYVPVQLLTREDAGFRAKLLTEPGFWQIDGAEANF